MGIDHAANEGFTANDYKTAHSHAGEGETGDTSRPASDTGKDDGIGNEFQVEYAVDDGDIDIPEDTINNHYQYIEQDGSNLKYTKWVRWLS